MRSVQVGQEDALASIVSALGRGEVVVVPTDTVYGLAAVPDRPDAVERIYLAKQRPPTQHLPVLAGSLAQVRALGVSLPAGALALADRWWPGPLTMVLGFEAGGSRPSWLAGREEVAVRIPRHDFLLAVLEATGVLLVTSANQHGSATPPSADEAAATLAPHVSLLVDAGRLDASPSTLVNVRGRSAVVEREGDIASSDIADALASVAGTS